MRIVGETSSQTNSLAVRAGKRKIHESLAFPTSTSFSCRRSRLFCANKSENNFECSLDSSERDDLATWDLCGSLQFQNHLARRRPPQRPFYFREDPATGSSVAPPPQGFRGIIVPSVVVICVQCKCQFGMQNSDQLQLRSVVRITSRDILSQWNWAVGVQIF